jgi:ribosomal protein S18 acetylase RimI-like enzyme
MADAEIRTFTENDRAALRELFARAGEGAPTETLWGHLDSEAAVYLTPYLDHEPGSVFLAVRDGALVGYLTGSLGGAVPGEDERIARAIREHRVMLRPRAMPFFARAAADVAVAAVRRRPTAGELHDPRWPAHLHINVAPEARGTGAGAGLVHRWFDRLAEHGSPGCHLQTVVENTRAVRFFTRLGFEPYGETPVVPGLRVDGRRVRQLTMVRPR